MDNSFEENFDLKSLLEDEGIEIKENKTHIIITECPNCFKKDKLFVDKKNKLWICYSCVKTNQLEDNPDGYGNLWKLLLALGFDEFQVKKIFKDRKVIRYNSDFKFEEMSFNSQVDDPISKNYEKKEIVPYKIPNYLLYLDCSPDQIRQFPEPYKYLWSRNVRSKKQIQSFFLYYNIYSKRIVFPAITMNKVCIGSQSRDITDRHKQEHPKCDNPNCDNRYHYYFKGEEEAPEFCPFCGTKITETYYSKSLNSTNFQKTEFFFNEQNIDWNKPVVLVEGPFDAINVENSIAFLGKVLSDTQFSILMDKKPPEIILYLDGDSAGDYSTQQIYSQLRPFFNVKSVYLEDGEDPGSYSLEDNMKKVQSALLIHQWYFKKQILYI